MGEGSEVNIIRCIKWDDYYITAKEVMFLMVLVCLFACLSVCKQHY